MLKNFVPFKALQVVFFAGCAAGAFAGSVAGMAAGFIAGNLLAPKSGDDLRHELADKSTELAGQLKEKTLKLREKAENLCHSIGEDIKNRTEANAPA